MSKTAAKSGQETPSERHQRIRTDAGRETMESIVVAIVLALLFRAFVAEAFVIPTGSMAPTLMGAHKDLTCVECGQPYQTGASVETHDNPQQTTVIAAVCPNCRHVNPLDLADNSNHATFNGDRILVSKFAYALSDPERWDVIVFKFPGNPKQNYIKRLVGLPEETLRIRYGDIFARPNSANEFTIKRKPHDKLLAMAHHVYDTQYQSDVLVKAEYPSRWQPWEPGAQQPPTDSWQIDRSGGSWKARIDQPADELKMMRYYHRYPDDEQWARAEQGLSLKNVDPYSSLAITDFYTYDAYVNVDAEQVWDRPPGIILSSDSTLDRLLARVRTPPGQLRDDYESGVGPEQFVNRPARFGRLDNARDGTHWVGDLIVEAEVEVDQASGELVLELVESAVTFQCRIDLTDGTARLEIIDLDGPKTFAEAGGEAEAAPSAATDVRGGQTHRLQFANCDDTLYLWVDGDPIVFDAPPIYSMSALRTLEEQRPYTQDDHPYDAAPAAIGVRGTAATVRQLRVLRDKYYIATKKTTGGLLDYTKFQYRLSNLQPDRRDTVVDVRTAILYPQLWDAHTAWENRRSVDFTMDQDQFFPMGDNSPESQDARCWVQGIPSRPGVDPDAYIWAEASYVPRDLLVGKALMVFWPHTWNTPVPFTPNLKRIGLIR